MLWLFVLSAVALAAAADLAKGKRATDREMYDQSVQFIQARQDNGVPSDQKLIATLLSSTKWTELVAQFGDPFVKKKKKTNNGKRTAHPTPHSGEHVVF